MKFIILIIEDFNKKAQYNTCSMEIKMMIDE